MMNYLTDDQIEQIIELREIYLLRWSDIQRKTGIKAQTCSAYYEKARGRATHLHFKSKVMSRIKEERVETTRVHEDYIGANWVPALKLIRGASYV